MPLLDFSFLKSDNNNKKQNKTNAHHPKTPLQIKSH